MTWRNHFWICVFLGRVTNLSQNRKRRPERWANLHPRFCKVVFLALIHKKMEWKMNVMLFWEQMRTFQDAAATRRAQIEMERPGKSRESIYIKQLEPTGLKHVQLQTPWKTTGWNWNPKSHKSHALQRIFPLPFVHNDRSISHFLFCWCAWINSSKFEKHCLTLEWRKQQIWYPVVNRCHSFPSRCFVSQANSRYLLLWCRKQREEQMWCSQTDHLKVYTNISWCKQVFTDILKFLIPDLREIRHARFVDLGFSSSKAPEKRPRRRRIKQGKIQRDLRGANRFRGQFLGGSWDHGGWGSF